MGCKIFIAMLTVGILQLHGLNALPVDSAPAPVLPCTLQEASAINQQHLQDGENRLNEINLDADQVITNVNEQVEKLLTERTSAGQDLLAGLQTILDQEIQNHPESVDCLSALQIQVDIASAKASYNLAKCTLKTQKKGLELKSKILKVQKKVESIKNKAVTSIGKCALSYYPYGSCADLDACCELEKNKSLLKVDKYASKIKYSAEEIVLDVDECLTEALEDTQKYILYINFNILNCSSAQPIGPGPNFGESGESGEITEAPEVAVTEGPGNPEVVETVAPEVPQQSQEPQGPQEPQGTEQPQEPQGTEQPQEPQGTEQPQEPQGTEQPQEPQGTEQPQEPQGPQDPQAPEEPQNPEEPQQPEQPQGPQEPQNPEEPQQPEQPQGSQEPQGTEEPEQVLDFSNQSGGNQAGSNQSGGNQGPSK